MARFQELQWHKAQLVQLHLLTWLSSLPACITGCATCPSFELLTLAENSAECLLSVNQGLAALAKH